MTDEEKLKFWRLLENVCTEVKSIVEDIFSESGYCTHHVILLMNLKRNQPVKITELAENIGLKQSNLSVMCKQAEILGLLKRERGKKGDERAVYISLDKKGEIINDEIENRLYKAFDELCGCADEAILNDISSAFMNFLKVIKVYKNRNI